MKAGGVVEGWRRDRVTMLKAGGVEAERTGDQNRGPEIWRNFRSAKVERVQNRGPEKLQICKGGTG